MNRIFRSQTWRDLCLNLLHKRLFCEISCTDVRCKPETIEDTQQAILSKLHSLPDIVLKECECFCENKPGVSKTAEYKNPEYHLYNKWSFYEVQIELKKYRKKQPSVFVDERKGK